MKDVLIKKKHNKVVIPLFSTKGSAGIDFKADSFIMKFNAYNTIQKDLSANKESIHLNPNERLLVGTGLYMAIPEGYELDIRPRSGMALKMGVTVINSPGTIDSDYRGEIGVILINTSQKVLYIEIGDKIAQGVFMKHETPNFNIVEDLPDTQRGTGGFGSTGTK